MQEVMSPVPFAAEAARVRVSVRVALAAIVAVVVLGASAAAWSVAESRRSLREQVLQTNLTSARIAASVVAAELNGHLDLVEGFAGRPSLVASVSTGDWEAAVGHLRSLRQVDGDLSGAALLDAEGRLRVRDPPDPSIVGEDFSSRDYFRGALGTKAPYLSDVFLEKGIPRAEVVVFASVVRDASGATLGVLEAALPVSRLDLATMAFEVPNRGSILLFDRAGHALTGPAAGPERRFASYPAVSRARAGASGVGELRVPTLPGRRLLGYAPVPGTGWVLLVEQPPSVAYRPVRSLTARTAGVGALILVVGLGVAVLVIRLLRHLDRARGQTAAIVTSMAEAVMITDPAGRIVSINPALERLAGWREEEVRGRSSHEVYRFFDAGGSEITPERLSRRDTGAPVAGDGFAMLLTRDGRRVPVQPTFSRAVDEKGHVLGGVVVTRDVTREREIDLLKSSVISTVSHELRTPLTMISGFSELLSTRDLTEEKSREALRQIDASAERLSRLVDDLLSVSRLESGRVEMRTAPVHLAGVVQEATAPFGRERLILTELEQGLPPVLADRDKLVQILTNLVSNAVKFSPANAPVVIAARREGASARISMSDRGIGMTEKEAASLFERFYRVERPEVVATHGAGLGLYITKNLVEMHGGQIWVTSEPGRGSTFSFSLPLATDRKEQGP